MSLAARSQVLRPVSSAAPYSVTMVGAWLRGVVMMSPAIWGRMREWSRPFLSVKVEVRQKSTGEVKKTKSVTAHVYVLVPQVEWRDNRVLCSEAYTKQDCLDHDFVSDKWVADNGWKYTTEDGDAPAATGSAGTLRYDFVNKAGTKY